MDDWLKVSIGAAVGGILTLAAAVATGWFSFASKNEELRVHLVEIAIGILRADPKDNVTPARAWAIDVIEKNSGVPFLEEDRKALMLGPIVNVPTNPFGGANGYGGYGVGPYLGGAGGFGFGGAGGYGGGAPYANPYTRSPSTPSPSPQK